jgi:hypothetical protein
LSILHQSSQWSQAQKKVAQDKEDIHASTTYQLPLIFSP